MGSEPRSTSPLNAFVEPLRDRFAYAESGNCPSNPSRSGEQSRWDRSTSADMISADRKASRPSPEDECSEGEDAAGGHTSAAADEGADR
jgi:hypothetical protein